MDAGRPSKLPLALLIVFGAIWAVLAWQPAYRQDWALENLLVAVGVPWLCWGYRRVRFSDASYLLIFAFLVLHEVGAHYTYAEVPYDAWARGLFGTSVNEMLGLSRNHFDRLVHFLFGLLTTPALAELVQARAPTTSPLWRAFLPWCIVVASSSFFELVEWAAALVFGGPLGAAYLGTQGDVWDAQQDMFLAALGSLVAVLVLARRRPQAGIGWSK